MNKKPVMAKSKETKNEFLRDLEELKGRVISSRMCLSGKIWDATRILDTANLGIYKKEDRFWAKVLKHLGAIEDAYNRF